MNPNPKSSSLVPSCEGVMISCPCSRRGGVMCHNVMCVVAWHVVAWCHDVMRMGGFLRPRPAPRGRATLGTPGTSCRRAPCLHHSIACHRHIVPLSHHAIVISNAQHSIITHVMSAAYHCLPFGTSCHCHVSASCHCHTHVMFCSTGIPLSYTRHFLDHDI